jgi:Family of unknown function (DUF5906)
MTKEKDANDILKQKGKVDYVEFNIEDEPNNVQYINSEARFLERMNNDHIFINSFGGKPAVIAKVYSDVFKRLICEYVDTTAIKTRYSNEFMPQHKNPEYFQSLGSWWIEDTRRNEVDTVVFEPGEPTGKFIKKEDGRAYFNAWEGFAVTLAKGSWHWTIRHIYSILCNSDKIKFKYFIRWLAWAVQNPGIRAEVAVAFKGKQGAGKGFIFTQFVQIFGRHGMSMSNAEHLVGKHNAHLMFTSFLFADEAYAPGDKKAEGVLKQLITEPNLTVEPKFQNTRLANNCLHVCMSTNNDWVIAAGDAERRYFINRVEDTYAKNQATDVERNKYFTKLWGEMNNGGREAMLHDLLKMKLGAWHPRIDMPDTKEMTEQKFMTLGKKEKIVLSLLEQGKFPGTYTPHKEYIIYPMELQEYLGKLNSRAPVHMRLVAITLKKIGVIFGKRDGKRCIIFPELGELKLAWNKQFMPYEWDDYDNWETVDNSKSF